MQHNEDSICQAKSPDLGHRLRETSLLLNEV